MVTFLDVAEGLRVLSVLLLFIITPICLALQIFRGRPALDALPWFGGLLIAVGVLLLLMTGSAFTLEFLGWLARRTASYDVRANMIWTFVSLLMICLGWRLLHRR